MSYRILIQYINSLPPQNGIVKLNNLLKGHNTWINMIGTEHQQFGKYLKNNSYLLNGNINFYGITSNHDGLYC